MKKLFLALCVWLSLAAPAIAMDSTALFDTKVLGTDIQKSISEIPVGTVIVWPAGANPTDPENWLECDGRTVSQAKYPELYAVVGGRTPNYYNQFLRGGSTSQVGQVAADTTRSHQHTVPAHSHTVSGTAGSQSVAVSPQNVTGTAEAQKFWDYHTGVTTTSSDINNPQGRPPQGGRASAIAGISIGSGGDPSHGHSVSEIRIGFVWDAYMSQTNGPSAVAGKTSGGTYSTSGGSITGWTNSVASTTDSSGGAETAPQHTRVRYLIRALP